jgi:hypothetical protein
MAQEQRSGQDTYEVSVTDTDKITGFAREHELTEREVVERMVDEYVQLHDEGWVVFNETIEQPDPTESLVFYPGEIVRNVILLLGVLYGIFVFLIGSLFLPIVGNSLAVSFPELVATVGFLLVSLLVLLTIAILLQTTLPERVEKRYLD